MKLPLMLLSLLVVSCGDEVINPWKIEKFDRNALNNTVDENQTINPANEAEKEEVARQFELSTSELFSAAMGHHAPSVANEEISEEAFFQAAPSGSILRLVYFDVMRIHYYKLARIQEVLSAVRCEVGEEESTLCREHYIYQTLIWPHAVLAGEPTVAPISIPLEYAGASYYKRLSMNLSYIAHSDYLELRRVETQVNMGSSTNRREELNRQANRPQYFKINNGGQTEYIEVIHVVNGDTALATKEKVFEFRVYQVMQ